MTASGTGCACRHVDDLTDEGGLLPSLDLDLHADRPHDTRPSALGPHELGVQAHARAGRHRAREADLLGPVVDAHDGVGDGDDLAQQHRQQRERQVAVRNRRAEGTVRGRLGIDVNPLVITGRLGEQVDLLLRDLVPLARAEVAPGPGFELGKRQRRRHSSSRKAFRSALPTGVNGSASTTWISRGYLYPPRRFLANASSSPSSSVEVIVTNATTSSPYTSSGRPSTQALATAGCSSSASSTSRGKTLKPPRMIRSFLRSTIVR